MEALLTNSDQYAMSVCAKCGKEYDEGMTSCPHCGWWKPGHLPPISIGRNSFNPFKQEIRRSENAPGAFLALLHSYSGSKLFLVGAILFTAEALTQVILQIQSFSDISRIFGMVGGILGSYAASLSSAINSARIAGIVLGGVLQTLTIIGLWLLYAAAKSPQESRKNLVALTLLKINLIIGLVRVSIITLLPLAFLVITKMFTPAVEWVSGGIQFSIMVVAPIGVLVIIYYYKAALDILGGTRDGILSNSLSPLTGVKAFSTMTCISVFGTLVAALGGTLDVGSDTVPDVALDVVEMLGFTLSSPLTAVTQIIQIVTGAVTVLLLRALNLFNYKLSDSGL
jgi:hypothetical protein